MASFETETTIDVSQNAQSSPVPSQGATVQVQHTVDRGEDSIKEIPETYQGGPVQTPQPVQPDEEDELYSLSPQGKKSQEKRRAAAHRPEAANGNISKPPAETSRPWDSNEERRDVRAETSLSAVDALITRGATVHEPIQAWNRQSLDHVRHELMDEEQDELQMNDDGLSEPIGSNLKSSRKPAYQSVSGRAQAAHTPGISRTEPSAKASPLAALQARKAAQRTGTNAGAPLSRSTINKPSNNKVVPDTRIENVQTPARNFANEPQPQHRGTKGKLPPRKGGMFAHTSAGSSAMINGLKRGKKAADEEHSEGTDVLVNGGDNKRRGKKPSTVNGPLKAPPRAVTARTAKRDTTYDLSDSPDAEERQQSKANIRSSKATPLRKRARPEAKSASARRSRQPIKATPKPAPNARPNEGQHERDYAKPLSTRARMRSQSNSKPPETAARPAKLKEKALATSRDDSGKENQKNGQDDEPEGQITKESKANVIRYDQGKMKHTPAILAVQEPPPPHGTTDESTVTVEGNTMAPKASENMSIGEQTTYEGPGKSQDNATVPSDGQQSSPLTELLSPQRGETPSIAPIGDIDDEARSKALAPKTPKVLRSSPPIATGQTLLAGHTGLIDAGLAQKGAIVAFDKSGPRNQGVLSTRKRVPQSARSSHAPLSPTAPLLASGASSRYRLDARRRNGPSSAATSMKSFKINRSAPLSNVANTVDDALDSFRKKAVEHPAPENLSNVAVSPVAPCAELQRQPHAHNVDFTHIDDFEGPTLVDGMQPSGEELGPRHPVDRTDSQVVMPPPAPKASKRQRSQRAPTVPSMLGSEAKASPKTANQTAGTRPMAKRAPDAEVSGEPVLKRVRTSRDAEGAHSRSPEKPSSLMATLNLRRKPTLSQQENKHFPDPFQRGSRKPSRHASQGSRKVDIGGSPVPQGMVLQDYATVLETFSQQAGLSADAIVESTAVTRKTAGAATLYQTTFPEAVLPPSHQPEIMSSNLKPVPGSPGAESQAITAIASANYRQPLVENQTELPSTDPFTSSEEARKQPRQGSSSSNFLDQLRRQAQAQLTTASELEQVEDPDKTLVEATRDTRPRRRVPSISTAASSESSPATDQSTASMRGLSTWRNALHPHQMNLFDELVAVSHRLVRHLVDRETAATGVVEDYRRRGLTLVEQMELNHAKQYQQYVDTLNQRKLRLRKDLSDCCKKLKESVGVVAAAQRERKECAKHHDDTADQLQDIMTKFC